MPFSFNKVYAIYKYIFNMIFPYAKIMHLLKRVYLFTSINGSLTIEAAIIIPFVTFFTIIMCSPLFIINTELILRDKMVNCSLTLSEYFFILDKSDNVNFLKENNELTELAANGLSVVYARNSIVNEDFSEHLENSIIFDKDSISFKLSSISKEDCIIDITVDYVTQIHLPSAVPSMHLIQRCYVRGFAGLSITESDYEPVRVYIAKYGSVYHKTKDCHYLYNTSYVELTHEQKINYKNDMEYMGVTYKSCSRCLSHYSYAETKYIYLSIGAYAYHYSLECPTLTRTVYSANLDQISDDYSPCHICY